MIPRMAASFGLLPAPGGSMGGMGGYGRSPITVQVRGAVRAACCVL
jgi:hypothetical protein